MQKQILAIGMLAIVASLGFTAISSNTVFAQGGPPGLNVPPNTWGKAASGLGQSGEMGGHASNPGDLNPDQPGREGLGNVLDPRQPNSPGAKHPSNLPGVLCPPNSQDPLCR